MVGRCSVFTIVILPSPGQVRLVFEEGRQHRRRELTAVKPRRCRRLNQLMHALRYAGKNDPERSPAQVHRVRQHMLRRSSQQIRTCTVISLRSRQLEMPFGE